jgi:hypothetical protein
MAHIARKADVSAAIFIHMVAYRGSIAARFDLVVSQLHDYVRAIETSEYRNYLEKIS